MTGLATCRSLAPNGIGAAVVEVEVHVARGLPSMGVIGLPGASIGEARWRVRSAIASSGLRWPQGRITVGLSPADLPKNGTGLDLAIALALLAADGGLAGGRGSVLGSDTAVVGELGLDGQVRGVRTALAMALEAQGSGIRRLLLPIENAEQAIMVPDLDVVGVSSLLQAIAILCGTEEPERFLPPTKVLAPARATDLSDVRGQSTARYALEVMAVGGHHGLFVGEAGAGKTMLAERLPGIMSPLTPSEALEVTAIHAALQAAPMGNALLQERPFIAPHHTLTVPALIGSIRGAQIHAGAVTLAHRGVLFLDEAPEIARPCLEALREPLESRSVALARAGGNVSLPAACQVLLAANPCPCGKSGGRSGDCDCQPMAKRRYAARLSGPFLDRIDVRVPVEQPTRADLRGPLPESSQVVRERVLCARERMLARTSGLENAHVSSSRLRSDLAPSSDGIAALEAVAFEGPRGLDRILRLSWSIADLKGCDRPGLDEVSVASALRSGAPA